MSHRIREAMRDGVLAPMGGNGIVEADETYSGKPAERKPSHAAPWRTLSPRRASGPRNKRAIISLVERGGAVRSFHVENADKATVSEIVTENIAKEARVHTDESRIYSDVVRACRRATKP